LEYPPVQQFIRIANLHWPLQPCLFWPHSTCPNWLTFQS